MPTGLRRRIRAAFKESAGDDGNAVVEFIFLGVLLLVPLIYFIVALGQVQGASYAVTGAADHAAKVYAAADPAGTPEAAARDAAGLAFSDFGFDASGMEMDVTCSAACLAPGSTVTVTVAFDVPLPLFASIPGLDLAPVRVDSTSMQTVERFGS
ncbi:hypothetical protein [Arthrobacter caoxuetaonis]|uniref:hypothetical protein n=1 Tax=Arthrobacter caoxuetaonis TaxID=2886935 RepID=UPI001D155F99|nr:hypothetical protein [Arthrobacter caoxuetaonis]MCC3280950.1 hypothetical protein [Arthrobacter caoxuetaonis]